MATDSTVQDTKSKDLQFQLGAMVDRNRKEYIPAPDPDEVKKLFEHWVKETAAGRLVEDLTTDEIEMLKRMDRRNRLSDRVPEEIVAILGLEKRATYSMAICKATFQFEVQNTA